MRPSGTVDHLVFGNAYGMVVVAGSIGEGPDRDRWQSRLRHHVRMEEFQGRQPPSTALSYLVLDDGTAAVIRRFDDGPASRARGRTHVLVGPAEVLTPDVAIGLDTWGRWNLPVAPGVVLPVVAVAELTQQRDAAQQYLDEEARRREKLLRPVLAALAAEPTGQVIVLGCRPDDAIPVMWGLRRVAGQAFPDPTAWTFSTYEAKRLDGPQTARILFLPERPEAYSQRRPVDAQSGSTAGIAQDIADWVNRSVDEFVHSARPALAPPPAVPSGSDPYGQDEVHAALPVEGVGARRGSGGQSSIVFAQAGPGMLTTPVAADPGAAAPPASGGSPSPYYGGRQPEPPVPDDGHAKILVKLLAARDAHAFFATLDKWDLYGEAGRARRQLRPDAMFLAFEHIASLTSDTQYEDHAAVLLGAVLGDRGIDIRTSDGFAYVQEMLQISMENSRRAVPLLKWLVRATHRELGGMDQLGEVVVAAYLDALGLTRHEPPPLEVAPEPRSWLAGLRLSTSTGRGRTGSGALSHARTALIIGGIVLVIVATLVFVLSRLFAVPPVAEVLGEQVPASTQPVEPAPTTTDPAQPTTEVAPEEDASGTILPARITVAAAQVGDRIAYVLYRATDAAIIGPDCVREGDFYVCQPDPANAPSQSEFPRVQVGVSTQNVRDMHDDGPINLQDGQLPEGMSVARPEPG